MEYVIEAQTMPLEVDRHGVIRVGGTRVPLDTVVEAFGDGATPEEIVYQYPSLNLSDVYSAIGYYLQNRAKVEDYLKKRQIQAETVRKEYETRFPAEGIRARLLARMAQKEQ
ncbi:MAG: DUF433 domain-containing protein [Anaerolineales bacterium]|jgi:uncharacterized protein (DUF433 family)|nr:DUF433 domain-containing protein [Anaerolineales bacterium]